MDAGDLVGVWRLVSWSARTPDGSVTYPFGEGATGLIIYTPAGTMAVQIASPQRPNFSTEDLLAASDSEAASAFGTYLAYSGRYELEGDTVIHHVDHSLFPNWVGTAQRRHAGLESDGLHLRATPMKVRGTTVVNELHWRRVERF